MYIRQAPIYDEKDILHTNSLDISLNSSSAAFYSTYWHSCTATHAQNR